MLSEQSQHHTIITLGTSIRVKIIDS